MKVYDRNCEKLNKEITNVGELESDEYLLKSFIWFIGKDDNVYVLKNDKCTEKYDFLCRRIRTAKNANPKNDGTKYFRIVCIFQVCNFDSCTPFLIYGNAKSVRQSKKLQNFIKGIDKYVN